MSHALVPIDVKACRIMWYKAGFKCLIFNCFRIVGYDFYFSDKFQYSRKLVWYMYILSKDCRCLLSLELMQETILLTSFQEIIRKYSFYKTCFLFSREWYRDKYSKWSWHGLNIEIWAFWSKSCPVTPAIRLSAISSVACWDWTGFRKTSTNESDCACRRNDHGNLTRYTST